MAKQNNLRVNRKQDGAVLPLILILLLLAALAMGMATLWQKNQEKNNPLPPSSPSSAPPNLIASSSVPGSSAPESASSGSVSSSAPSSEAPVVAPVFGQPVPKSARVTTEYFNDAVFVGDSITTGLELYGILPDSNVVASTGINLDTILSKAAIETPNGNLTILQAMKGYAPKKIYVMLGANGLGFLTSEQTADYYSTFLDAMIAQHPDATIYVQSILPIEETLFAQKYAGKLDNAKINACNALLMEMAGNKQVHYLDVSEAFKDESGGMPRAATSDGLHFGSDYYTKWVDYLKTHVVMEDE